MYYNPRSNVRRYNCTCESKSRESSHATGNPTYRYIDMDVALPSLKYLLEMEFLARILSKSLPNVNPADRNFT